MQLHTHQFGPSITGYMNLDGAGSGACIVWVGTPPVGGFPNPNYEYWYLPFGFPATSFNGVQGAGAGPAYSTHEGAWRAAENKPFGSPVPSSFSVTLGASDRIYDVACYVNGSPVTGPTYQMWVRQTANGPQMGWVATNLPVGQSWLFPDGTTGTMGILFTPKPSGTYTWAAGVRVAVGPMSMV